MRVPIDQLVVEPLSHGSEVITLTLTLGNRRVKEHLIEHVGELVLHLCRGRVGLNRLDEFKRFFDEVPDQRLVCLHPVPGAAILGEQRIHRLNELRVRAGHCGR